MSNELTQNEREILLQLARAAISAAVFNERLSLLDLEALPESLRRPGAAFVTLTRSGELRGCIGALEARLPLAEDVREHAVAAALEDYRFPPVLPDEVPQLKIEISRLTPPQPLAYDAPEELLACLRPGVDGVILQAGSRRATFLPQVWDKIPDPVEFLAHLCLKMGAEPDLWLRKKLQIAVYQVEEFHD